MINSNNQYINSIGAPEVPLIPLVIVLLIAIIINSYYY